MKLERVKSRKYKDTQYYKNRLIIPQEIINQANFKEGDELEAEAKKGEIKIKKKSR